MNLKICQLKFILYLIAVLFFSGCGNENQENYQHYSSIPKIEPDYTEVTVPANIAPLNFKIKEDGKSFKVIATSISTKEKITLNSTDGIIRFPKKQWKNLIAESRGNKIEIQVFSNSEENIKFKPFNIYVSTENIDNYLVYRLIHPGYYSWSDIKIVQRNLENFMEESVVENRNIDKNCVNCHSFNQNNPDEFLIHIRGSKGGTYFIENDSIVRTNLKTENMPGGATYPAWHPSGNFIAFSSNQVRQNFYAHASKSIEVFDLISTIILYDKTKNEITTVTKQDSVIPLETFPTWSPDGKFLYYCSGGNTETGANRDLDDLKNIHYNIYRKSFNAEKKLFGEPELFFNASKKYKSASFPRISPDGKLMVFTLQDYGTFPVWHSESDLYITELETGKSKRMDINSDKAESYHSWSSNGKWLVFGSKRFDGRSTFPYFAFVNSFNETGKAFILPQENPEKYSLMLESFNIPELIKSKIKVDPRNFENAVSQIPLQSKQGESENEDSIWKLKETSINKTQSEKGIHE